MYYILDCGEPDIPNGALSTASNTTFNGSAVVECDAGYEVQGSDIATCLSSGNWDILPTCQPKGICWVMLLALNVKPFGHLKFIKGRMNVGTLYKRYVPAGISLWCYLRGYRDQKIPKTFLNFWDQLFKANDVVS